MSEYENRGYIVVTDYLTPGSGDVSDALQELIDKNPNRTIYFPDGIYTISKPVMTPADPTRSVDLRLSNYAVIKAADGWDSDEAMIRLGGVHPYNSITIDGSNYAISGGIIDGGGIADAVSVDSGRETKIYDVSIKHARVGIHIKHGANSGSSDCDIRDVNIVGTGGTDSVGVLLEGYDNTLTNMRIANVFRGIELKSAGNFLRNLHPLYTSDYTDYQESAAFYDHTGNNWYDNCYSDQFAVGFRTADNAASVYDCCFCMWYSPKMDRHTGFKSDGRFASTVKDYKIGFRGDGPAENVVLDAGAPGGRGVFDRLLTDESLLTDRAFEEYLVNGIR